MFVEVRKNLRNAPVAQLAEREAYTLCMHQISARFQVRSLAGVLILKSLNVENEFQHDN